MERDFIFEYAGSQSGELEIVHENFLNLGETPTLSLIVEDIAGNEIFRWNLFEFGLSIIEPGSDGRTLYVMQHQLGPDNLVKIEEGPPGGD